MEDNLQYLEHISQEKEVLTMEFFINELTELKHESEVTFEHSIRVANLSRQFCQWLGLQKETVDIVHKACLIHDLGKLAMTEIVHLNRSLNSSEFDRIKQHPTIGLEYVTSKHAYLDLSEDERILTAQIVKHHHERFDGRGYPSNLAGEEIPFLVRIVAICDSFDAMSNKRGYNDPSVDYALKEIEDCAGTQFDPVLAKEFLQFYGEPTSRVQ